MGLYESVLRPALFQLDPERAHEMAMGLLQKGILKARSFSHPILEQELFGLRFANPLGLAAGFDKNALAVDQWHQLGFGFVEVGTVTFHAQPGNERPRLFRLPQQKALINRMGFNNDGARTVAGRLAEARPQVPMGVNLGKSKITTLEEAPDDYRESFRLLRPFGGYFVVNVSSPNTPGLRSLQEKGPLSEIIAAIQEVDREKPLFVKVSPDLELSALDDVIDVAREYRLTGLIATNTTISRDGIPEGAPNRDQAGGLSGAPLRDKSNDFLSYLYRSCGKEMVLIGAGGIFTAKDLYTKLALGAHLAQVYTGWIYGGPQMVPNLLEDLVGLLVQEGISSLSELRGSQSVG